MYTITIAETTSNKQQMADILREIATELEHGESFGDDLNWRLFGEEYMPTPEPPSPKLPEGFSDEVLKNAAIALFHESDSKLKAIKFVKDNTGWGLKESKDYIDALL